jgi:hypothetical protein
MKAKKFLVVILALALMLSICACSGGTTATVDKTVDTAAANEDENVVETEDIDEEAEGEPTTMDEPEDEETAEPVEDDTTSAADEISEIRGTISDSTYTNTYFDVEFNFSDDWTVASEDELLELSGIVADSSDDSNISEALANSTVFYDLYATADEGLESVNITIENLGEENGSKYDESAYADAALASVESALESAGLSNVTAEKVTVTSYGQEYYAIKVYCEYAQEDADNVPIYELVAIVKNGNYVACITAASYYTDYTYDMLGVE